MRQPVIFMVLLLVSAVLADTASATPGVVFFDNKAAFDTASATTLRATFEGFTHAHDSPGIANPYTEGGVTFSANNLYVAVPGGATVTGGDQEFSIASNVLTVSGNEDIRMTFTGPAPTAIGFEAITNRFDAPVVSVFDTADVLIGTYVLTQPPMASGFVGITSSVGIGAVRWLADRGEIKDSAIDNVYVGQVPEPSTYAMLAAGLGLLALGTLRRALRPLPVPGSIGSRS